MTAITRESAWRELAQLVIESALPYPDGIRFQPGIIAVSLGTGGDLLAWADFLGAKPTDPQPTSDGGGWLQSAHAWNWHGWTVQLFTSNAQQPATETAAGAERSPADGASDAVAPFDGDAPAADPAPVSSGDGAAVTPAEAEQDPCPAGDPTCETGDDGSCHDGCTAPAEDSEWEQVYQALTRVSGPAHRWVRTADVTQAVRDVTGLPSLPVARRLDALLSGGRVDKSTDRGLTGMRGTCWRPRLAKTEG